MKKQLLLLLVGASGCLFTAVNPLSAQVWTLTSALTNTWTSIACSADGSKLVAAANGGGIYTSTNFGATWTPTSAYNASWTCVGSSADGTKLAVLAAKTVQLGSDDFFAIIISTNSGATWYSSAVDLGKDPDSVFIYWSGFCLSADGSKLAVAESSIAGIYFFLIMPGSIFTSTDLGADWNAGPSGYWDSVACSADGTRLVAASIGSIYTSTDSGATWAQATNGPSGAGWTSVASSADGSKLVVAVKGGGIYTSTNSGATWILTSAPTNAWISVASSADGSKLVAAVTNSIYTSTDSGVTWTQATNGPSGAVRTSVASSADGNVLVAAVNGGGIYISQTTPAPVLNIIPSSDNLAFSWLVPSTNFVLQQCSDLCTSDWTDVMNNTPALNLTNLQNQVALPLPTGNAFYRLKTP